MQRCVDENNRVVDPKLCSAHSSPGFIPVPHVYRYYYGGGGTYAPGSVVNGGKYAPAAGHSYSTTNGTVRGGFGGSFSGEGAEGGAHGGGGE